MTDQFNNSANKSARHSQQPFAVPIGASPAMANIGSALPGVSPAGSHMPQQRSHMGRMEPSNL